MGGSARALVLQTLLAWPEEINRGMCLSVPAPRLVLELLRCPVLLHSLAYHRGNLSSGLFLWDLFLSLQSTQCTEHG